MAGATLECKICGARVVLQPSRKGQTAMVALAGAEGWRFDTDNGWRCPEHFQRESK